MNVEFDVPLSSKTSFGVGGPAALWFDATPASLPHAVQFARRVGGPILVLGSGTNVLVSDDGWPGTVIHVGCAEPSTPPSARNLPDGGVEVVASACTPLDAFVAHTVRYQWQGLECLSGIPGSVGAAPVQNVSAYDQRICEVITSVQAFDLTEQVWRTFTRGECMFGYRTSVFSQPQNTDRYVITQVTMRLIRGGDPCRTHPDINKSTGPCATVGMVREAVLRVRHRKGMLLGSHDSFASAGSFFKNPVIPADEFERSFDADTIMMGANKWWWPTASGMRVSAAHLIERAGFAKGYARGKAAISSKHTLCIVNAGGASATDIVGLALEIQDAVASRFTIILEPEVRPIGFPSYPLLRS
ncbi:MAG TPA: UDP-N-acetylmuramate dehydrogenase [Candidatus Paceibacterota bacterium]|nr:UDP-N-acetylmuramate dehydrogenase [Candidatus Paceibacterota bacterium]